MLKKPIYENENNVELYALYASENNNGVKKCPLCGRTPMSIIEAIEGKYENVVPAHNYYCKKCKYSFS